MYAHTVGTKYNQALDITDIAKQVRADLKEAFPGLKFSVRIDRYSMGQSIKVEGYTQFPVKGRRNAEGYWENGPYNDRGRAIYDKVYEIVHAYNYDDSDVMTDYFNVNFYAHIDIAEVVNV